MKPPKKKKKGMAGLVQMGHDNEIFDDIEDVDEETIRKLFLDEGILKDKTGERKKAKMFQGNYCEISCYLFKKKSKFRECIYNI